MTASVVVDTDVFSDLYKGDTRAAAYARHLVGTDPHLAFATVAELPPRLVAGPHQPPAGRDGKYTTLHSDEQTALRWAGVMSIKGQPVSEGDAWIAAVALRHDMPLVTHNRKHFEGIPGLTLISES